MTPRHALMLFLCGLVLTTSARGAATARGGTGEVRRFALLAGTNDGGTERVRLRYAVSDAKRLAEVLQQFGGIDAGDVLMLEEADRAALLRGLTTLSSRLERARKRAVRTEVIVYYSGHSDEQGLLLGNGQVTYSELRAALSGLPADLRVAILDSCASGSMTRRKGGVRRPSFLLDTSRDIRGQAILTSSSMDEASQESDRLGASFFTHHLVSGLRGAADSSRDGVVTLNEAYEYAFRETLARTESTQAGPQHPVYDVDLVGAGELVMTDLRQHSAGITFAQDVEGQLFIRDGANRLVMELRKTRGETAEVSLAAGSYVVSRQDPLRLGRARLTLDAHTRPQLSDADFKTVAREATVSRGAGAQEDAEQEDGGVEDTVTHRFLNLALVPPLELSALEKGPVHHRASLGLLVATSDGIDGFAFGGLAHRTRGDASGVQLSGALNYIAGTGSGLQLAGAANHNGGDFSGIQLSGAANLTRGSFSGLQLAGALNVSGSPFDGVQLAGALNVTGSDFTGLQIAGAANWGGASFSGAQLSGGFNHATRIRGWQVSGGVNHASSLRGAQLSSINIGQALNGTQLGVINVGGDVEGAQLGVINVATSVRGAQLGVLNLAGEVHGESLGLLSFSRNGRFQVEAYSGDGAPLGVAVKLGAGVLHSVLSAEALYRPEGQPASWSTGLGLGAHLTSGRWSFSPDLIMRALQHDFVNDDARFMVQLRMMGGYQLADRLTLIAGPTLNVGFHIGHATPPAPTLLPTTQLGRAALWAGAQVGLRY